MAGQWQYGDFPDGDPANAIPPWDGTGIPLPLNDDGWPVPPTPEVTQTATAGTPGTLDPATPVPTSAQDFTNTGVVASPATDWNPTGDDLASPYVLDASGNWVEWSDNGAGTLQWQEWHKGQVIGIAGAPGEFKPSNKVPAAFANLSTVPASPTSAWAEGEYVVLGDGSHATYKGVASGGWAEVT